MLDDRTIGELGEVDLPELLALLSACPGVPVWTEATWAGFLRPEDPGLDLHKRVFAARAGRRLIGVVAVNVLHETTEVELLAVHPEWRARGVGGDLSRHWMWWAWQAGAAEALLEVRASNDRAQRLYRALGFRENGRRRGYYSEPEEDAILMRRSLEAGWRHTH